MSDTKLRPEDLTSEERAIVDNAALFYRRVTGDVGETAEWAYVEALKEAEPIILARRALFAPAPEKAAKAATTADRIAADLAAGTFRGVKPEPEKACQSYCPHCDAPGVDHYDQRGFYTCHPSEQQPAPPEPAAREMPEAVRDAVDTLRSGVPSYPTWRQYADTLESWWRNLAQPVAVGMTKELSDVLAVAEEATRREPNHPQYQRSLRSIAAVRQQAAQGRKVALPKVREFLTYMGLYYKLPFSGAKHNAGTQGALWQDALAELDAAEGKVAG